jgi:dTDP-4-dehydrorhamnose reductase
MKLLIVGSNGQLGKDMAAFCEKAEIEFACADIPEIDITDLTITRRIISLTRPDCIINCSAYTAVDAAEKNEASAFAVNAAGVANIATAAVGIGASVVHFGTDYVFDGSAKIPYVETDKVNPKTVYGKSKLAGERLLSEICPEHYIIRIAWLYGRHGENFVKTIRRIAPQKKLAKEPLMVVEDQIGTPTWTVDVCRQTIALISTRAYGLYHSTSEGSCSWYDFARAIVAAAGVDVEIVPCATSQFPRPAPRPAYSVLENKALKNTGLNRMPQWQEGFNGFLSQEKEAGLL